MPYMNGQWVDATEVTNVLDGMRSILGGDSWPDSVNALFDAGKEAAGVFLGADKAEVKQAAKDAAVTQGPAVAAAWWKSPIVLGAAAVGALLILWRVLR